MGLNSEVSIGLIYVVDSLRENFRFYDWNPATREVRWMTAFDTQESDIDAFVAAITGSAFFCVDGTSDADSVRSKL